MTGAEGRAVGFLGPDGPIAARLSDYEGRPQQMQLAAAVEHALANGRHLVAEAGTGTGKSFAYLVPAADHAERHQGQGPIVISTRTIALQEQLEKKDLPFLHAVLPMEWSSVTAIGRNNYVCLRRRDLALREQDLFDEPERREQLERIVEWSSTTARDGTRLELDPPPSPAVWEEVQAEHGNCLHRACRHYDRCYWQRARRRMQTAQVLVVNHALYFADLALRIAGASYLPPHRVVVFDEAHHLASVATESLGLRLGPRTVHWHLRRLHKRRSERSLLARHGSPAARLCWEEAWQLNEAFFAELEARVQQSGGRGGVALHDEAIDEPLTHVLATLAQEVANAAGRTEQLELRSELAARAKGLDSLCGVVRALCRPGETATPLVRWLEPVRRGVQLCAAPLDVSAALRTHLFDGGPTAVLLSATIGTGDDPDFAWFRRKLGLDEADTLRLDSPFDYDRAVELVVEEAMPDPGREEHQFKIEAADRTARHVIDNGGRALVLCTSWDLVRDLARRLRPELEYHGIELLVQGEAPLARLLAKKREVPSSVLLGTDSLWEGIDVPGEALSLLVITRLPFQNPSHPLTQARLQALREAGRDPFEDHTLPEAILRFRQGFGRLIRNERDRGRVVILDPRARTRTYGRRFLRALPFSGEREEI